MNGNKLKKAIDKHNYFVPGTTETIKSNKPTPANSNEEEAKDPPKKLYRNYTRSRRRVHEDELPSGVEGPSGRKLQKKLTRSELSPD